MVKFAKKNPSSLKDEVIPSAFLIYSTQIFSLRTLSHIGAEDQQQIIEKNFLTLQQAFLIYSTQIFSLRTLSHIGAEDQQQLLRRISSLCSRRSTTVSKPACSKLNSNFFLLLSQNYLRSCVSSTQASFPLSLS